MDYRPFPELNLVTKRLIFWSLVTSFIVYSILIYTIGTNYSVGTEYFTETAQNGKLVFHEYNCISCHQIYGLGGYMGPDLTNIMDTEGKGRNYAEVLIKYGTAKMPRFEMSDKERSDLLDYLEYISSAGDYPVTHFQTTWYGNAHSEMPTNE